MFLRAMTRKKNDKVHRALWWRIASARIEAHIFVCFLAYCLQVTLKNLAKGHSGGLTPRAIIEQVAQMQMIDVHLPTTALRR